MIDEKQPLISIIVPCYNTKDYIEQCLDSLIHQSYKNLEIILVNDGSTDDTDAKIQPYLSDDRIRYIIQENKGLSGARNTGLDIMKGEYVCFVDSDDFLYKDYVKTLYENLIKTDADISICDFLLYYDDAPVDIETLPVEETLDVKSRDEGMDYIDTYDLKYILAWNKLYKAYIFDNIRYPLGKLHEDEFVAHHIFYKTNKSVFTSRKLYSYRQGRKDSIMSNITVKNFNDAVEAFDDRIKFYREHKIKTNSRYNTSIVKWNYVKYKYRNPTMQKDVEKYIKQNFVKFFIYEKMPFLRKLRLCKALFIYRI